MTPLQFYHQSSLPAVRLIQEQRTKANKIKKVVPDVDDDEQSASQIISKEVSDLRPQLLYCSWSGSFQECAV